MRRFEGGEGGICFHPADEDLSPPPRDPNAHKSLVGDPWSVGVPEGKMPLSGDGSELQQFWNRCSRLDLLNFMRIFRQPAKTRASRKQI